MAITLKGIVLPDGKIEVQGESPLRPGAQVQISVAVNIPDGSSLDEVKRWMAELDKPLTDHDRAELAKSYAILDAAAMDNTGLPDDYADTIETSPLPKMGSISLEEAKRRFAEPEREMTPEEEALYHEAYRILDSATIEHTGLPDDHVDEIDHTPRRNETE